MNFLIFLSYIVAIFILSYLLQSAIIVKQTEFDKALLLLIEIKSNIKEVTEDWS